MRDALFLAWHHLRHHRGRTTLLLLALSIVTFLPLAVDGLVDAGEKSLRSRAVSTPLVAGAGESALDVVLSALYFQEPSEATITNQPLKGPKVENCGARNAQRITAAP